MRIVEIGTEQVALLLGVAPGLFDNDILPDQARAFVADPKNLALLAFDGDLAVGMATASILLHPDKAPALIVNEVGTRESHQRRGIAAALMERLFQMARARGCNGIWLGTEADNDAALALYRKLGGTERHFVGFGWDEGL